MNNKNTKVEFKVITNKEDEIFCNDLDKIHNNLVFITKKDYDKDWTLSNALDKVQKTRPRVENMSRDDIMKYLDDVEVEKQKVKDNAPEYIYVSTGLEGNTYRPFCTIKPEDFTPTPKIPEELKKEIVLDTEEDIRNAINDEYEINVFTSPRQYKKRLAEFFIKNKDVYAPNHTDEEIWNSIVNQSVVERVTTPDKFEQDVLGKLEEVVKNAPVDGKNPEYKGKDLI